MDSFSCRRKLQCANCVYINQAEGIDSNALDLPVATNEAMHDLDYLLLVSFHLFMVNYELCAEDAEKTELARYTAPQDVPSHILCFFQSP